jgi:hypothetical protein
VFFNFYDRMQTALFNCSGQYNRLNRAGRLPSCQPGLFREQVSVLIHHASAGVAAASFEQDSGQEEPL